MKDHVIHSIQTDPVAGSVMPNYLCTPPNTVSSCANDILNRISAKPLAPNISAVESVSLKMKSAYEVVMAAIPGTPQAEPSTQRSPLDLAIPTVQAIPTPSQDLDLSSPALLYSSPLVLNLTYLFLNTLIPERVARGMLQLGHHAVIPCEILALAATIVSVS